MIRASWNAFSLPSKFLAVRVFFEVFRGGGNSFQTSACQMLHPEQVNQHRWMRFCVQLLLVWVATTLSSRNPLKNVILSFSLFSISHKGSDPPQVHGAAKNMAYVGLYCLVLAFIRRGWLVGWWLVCLFVSCGC